MAVLPPKITFWRSVRRWLFEPNAAIKDIGQRRQAQLMAWISLVVTAWFLMAVISIFAMRNATFGALVLLAVVVFSLISYVFSRTRHIQVASWILTTLFLVAGYGTLLGLPLKDASTTYLALVVLGFVIGSAVLPVRGLAFAVAANTLCWMVVAIFVPAADRLDFFAPAGSGTITGILLSIFVGVRNLIEKERLQETAVVNRELRVIQSTLEERVNERTIIAETARQDAESARQALESEIWLTNGQLAINEALRNQQDPNTMARNATQVICDYLEAPVGVLYILRDERLHFAGGRAFTPPPNQPHKSFAFGEGLIGQVARQRQPLILKQVPSGYLDISSGLGSTSPMQLAIWPLCHNEQLVGVIEIGLAHPLAARQEYFLQRVSESVAAALQVAQTRARIDELLKETQAQTEELQVREEELRTINEKLESQAEAPHDDEVGYVNKP
jgi:hypothetical protein